MHELQFPFLFKQYYRLERLFVFFENDLIDVLISEENNLLIVHK